MLICFKWATFTSGLFIFWVLLETLLFRFGILTFKDNDFSFYPVILGLSFPFMYYGIKEIRRFNDYRLLSFKEGVKYGLIITFFVSSLTSVFIYYYYKYIHKFLNGVEFLITSEFYYNPFVQSFYQFTYSLFAGLVALTVSSVILVNSPKIEQY
ncbi:MAG: hypothetical protein UZ04_CHB001000776 [Chlorobi bacterium OLB4]|nr:MAG: DUF4199 family protein [Chlorobiota bacterium]KXK04888.1 MAG: hypothetical protein UZ04_CHB001000776 [Chlorobi bacterium OLB4]MBV6397705.1 hypothetical protein [Ignavibacteria bacterium]MCC6885485.1 DUF4199 domain-containing protein [Ignavibacteriales bacterium]